METIEKEVILYTDTTELAQAKARAKQAENDLNSFVKLIEGEIGRKLAKGEALQVKNNALEWIENNLTFLLPNAPEAMRYASIGVNIDLIKRAWNSRTWGSDRKAREWVLNYIDGSFRLDENQPIYDGYNRYATPRQLEILEQAQALADALNIATGHGLDTFANGGKTPVWKIREIFPLVRYVEAKREFSPDLAAISRR